MAKTQIVYLNKDNEVILPLILDDEVSWGERFIAAINSDHFYVEIDNDCPADYGWSYDGTNVLSPSKEVWSMKNNFFDTDMRKVVLVVGQDVAGYVSWTVSNPKLSNFSEDICNYLKTVEVSDSVSVKIGWQYDGTTFSPKV